MLRAMPQRTWFHAELWFSEIATGVDAEAILQRGDFRSLSELIRHRDSEVERHKDVYAETKQIARKPPKDKASRVLPARITCLSQRCLMAAAGLQDGARLA
jgi:hypothetical protein